MECVGRHIRTDLGYDKILNYANKNNLCIIQIFAGNPSTFFVDKDIEEFIEIQKESKIKIVIHGHYTINLAKPTVSILYRKSIGLLIKLLKISVSMGDNCLGVIIHMGKNVEKLSNEIYLNNFVEGIKYCLNSVPGSCVIIETSAGQGTEIASKLPELYEIFKLLDLHNVKLCLDTCHVWAAGYVPNKKLLIDINKKIRNKLLVVHINNSATDINSRVDRHADLNDGKIRIEDLKEVILYAKKNSIYLIAETPLRSTSALEENKFLISI